MEEFFEKVLRHGVKAQRVRKDLYGRCGCLQEGDVQDGIAMDRRSLPVTAFILSIIAGALIIIQTALVVVLGSVSLLQTRDLAILGLVSGMAVLGGAWMMYRKADSHVWAGLVLIVFSITSIATGGGFILGAVLGFVAGILSIVWQGDEGEGSFLD